MRRAAAALLILAFLAAAMANFLAPYPYSEQFRDLPDASASRSHLLGTDELGRDRFSRLLYGARLSLLMAPAAALLSVGLAILIALAGVVAGPWWEHGTRAVANLFLSMPWIFLLLVARSLMPLNTAPAAVGVITFALLGLLGWAEPSRVMVAAATRYLRSDFALMAQASGCGRLRLAVVHLVPNLVPLAMAQFLIATPTFLLAEANLALLGLGVPEPLPSWGSLLRELESLGAISANVWTLAPAVLLLLVVSCFHLAVSSDKCVL